MCATYIFNILEKYSFRNIPHRITSKKPFNAILVHHLFNFEHNGTILLAFYILFFVMWHGLPKCGSRTSQVLLAQVTLKEKYSGSLRVYDFGRRRYFKRFSKERRVITN
jgi:hypothetical protein